MKRLRFFIFAFLFSCAFAPSARALTFDLNLFYFSDTWTAAQDRKYSRTMYDGAIMLNLNKRGDIVMGWSYASISTSDTDNNLENSYSSTEMGPRFGYYFDKEFIWSVFFTYNLSAKANVKINNQEVEWRGTTMRGELGYMPKWGDSLQVGLKLVYYKSSYGEEIPASKVMTEVSYGRTMIYPTISMIYRFN